MLPGARLASQQDPKPSVPLSMLANTLRIEDPEARRRAAEALAARDGIDVDDWLTALRTWKPKTRLESGVSEHTVELWNGTETELTTLHLYVPEKALEGGSAPLLHEAHGTGGTGAYASRMWRHVADELGMVVVAPSESGPNDGYHFHVREREIARSAIRWVKQRIDIDPNRVYLAGISRGGHLTWDVALRFPDVPAAIAPMIGGPRWNPDGQNNLRFLENIVRLPIRDLQGARDDPRMLINLELAFDRLRELGAEDAEYVEFPELGHSFELDAVDWSDFWTRRRDPRPDTVVRMMSTPDEGRAYWVEILEVDRKKVRDRFRPAVPTALMKKLDDTEIRRWISDKAEKATARLEITRTGPGKFKTTKFFVGRRILSTRKNY